MLAAGLLQNAPQNNAPKKSRKKPTTEVAVILSTSSTLAVFSFGSPVGHASQLVALGERRIGHAVQCGLGGDGGAPAIAGRAAVADADVVELLSHDEDIAALFLWCCRG